MNRIDRNLSPSKKHDASATSESKKDNDEER